MKARPNKPEVIRPVRAPNGRFLPGNPGSPGRLPRRKEEKYLTALTEEVSVEDWLEIIRAAKDQAKHGNKDARKWLSDLLVGRDPVQFFNMLFLGQEQRPSIEELRTRLEEIQRTRAGFAEELQQIDGA